MSNQKHEEYLEGVKEFHEERLQREIEGEKELDEINKQFLIEQENGKKTTNN